MKTTITNLQPDFISNYDEDLERSVLGACLIESYSLNDCLEIVKKPEIFYNKKNQIIYESLIEMKKNGEPIDLITVTNNLRKKKKLEEIGGAYYLTKITTYVNSSANIKAHGLILRELAIKRFFTKFGIELYAESQKKHTDAVDLTSKFVEATQNIMSGMDISSERKIGKLLMERIQNFKSKKAKDELTGIPSGLLNIDNLTGGWQKKDLIILAARPSMGKTALAIHFGIFPSENYEKSIGILSLEMSSEQIINRIIANKTEIPINWLKRNYIEPNDFEKITNNLSKIYDKPIYIDDTTGLDIDQIRSKAHNLKNKYGIELLIVDYLQLIDSKKRNSNREQEVEEISRGLKKIAKELDIPVIALAQLSRAVETRGGGNRPALSDLRNSGAIEQDADLVMFLYRPEYYKIEFFQNGESTRGIAEVIIAKHRQGPLNNVFLKTKLEYNKFKDYTPIN